MFKLTTGKYLNENRKAFWGITDISLLLPIWYQDRLMKQWNSGKLILQGKGYACISPDGSNELTWLPVRKIWPKGAPNIQTRDKTTKTSKGRNSNTSHGSFKSFQKHHTQCHRPYDFPTLGQIKTLANQAENLISQQGMPQNPQNIFCCFACFACFCFPRSGWLDWSHLLGLYT